jgi:hypothetical protein
MKLGCRNIIDLNVFRELSYSVFELPRPGRISSGNLGEAAYKLCVVVCIPVVSRIFSLLYFFLNKMTNYETLSTSCFCLLVRSVFYMFFVRLKLHSRPIVKYIVFNQNFADLVSKFQVLINDYFSL